MNIQTIRLMNNILSILNSMDHDSTIPTVYLEPVCKEKIIEYIKFDILKDFNKEELEELKSKIFNIEKNYNMAGIVCNEEKITKVLIPNLTNILSAIIIVHELNHYVTYKNKSDSFSYTSLYDEVIPINSEFKFLLEFYPYLIKTHENLRFESIINEVHIVSELFPSNIIQYVKNGNNEEIMNIFSHIYSNLLLMQNPYYKENAVLFDKINRSQNSLEFEFNKHGIYLRKSIIEELKSRK